MKRILKQTILISAIIFVVEGIRHFIFAAGSATVSVYPAFTGAPTPANMVNEIYNYALSIAGALAIIRVVYGGILYVISAGNSSKQSDAKDIITSAVWGIVLLAGAYLLLNTINPEIVKLKNPNIPVIPSGATSGGGAQGGGINNGIGTVSEQFARDDLLAGGVKVKPQCTGGSTACATLNGIQQTTINELLALKQQCDAAEGGDGCYVLVNEGTGGTHSTTGTLTHENGYKADLNYQQGNSLYNYITQNFTQVTGNNFTPEQIAAGYPSCSTYFCYQAPSGAIYMAEGNPPTHWDVTVPPPATPK